MLSDQLTFNFLFLGILTIEDIKAFRQIDSKTPGHPESFITPGVEATTGPLGQGMANGVGMAMAEAHLSSTFNHSDSIIFDNYTFVIVGDGCVQEGITSEASSLAAHFGLNKLIIFYDDNKVQIEGPTDWTFNENVESRYKSYGFHTIHIKDGNEDLEGIERAIKEAQSIKDRPSFIRLTTTIGYGSKSQGTEKVHGAPLGKEDMEQVKAKLGFENTPPFCILPEVYEFYRKTSIERGEDLYREWHEKWINYQEKYPNQAKEIQNREEMKIPSKFYESLPKYQFKEDGNDNGNKNQQSSYLPEIATRKCSEMVLNSIQNIIPELISGSADLANSTLTKWKGSVDFQNPKSGFGGYDGRNVRYGVREHAMFAISNGMAYYSHLVLPLTSTFLNFITYGWGAVRLAALSHLRTIMVMTHDSIGLGEDGPTHQPIEVLSLLRSTPNILTIRPADGNETSGAYAMALENIFGPTVLSLSRQNLPQLRGTDWNKVKYGAYIVHDVPNLSIPDIIIMATGSEVSLAISASIPNARIVSMPSWELFEKQDITYKRSIMTKGVPIMSVEAGSVHGWHKWAHYPYGMKTFGSSGPYKKVLSKHGFTPEVIAEKAKKLINYYKGKLVPDLLDNPDIVYE